MPAQGERSQFPEGLRMQGSKFCSLRCFPSCDSEGSLTGPSLVCKKDFSGVYLPLDEATDLIYFIQDAHGSLLCPSYDILRGRPHRLLHLGHWWLTLWRKCRSQACIHWWYSPRGNYTSCTRKNFMESLLFLKGFKLPSIVLAILLFNRDVSQAASEVLFSRCRKDWDRCKYATLVLLECDAISILCHTYHGPKGAEMFVTMLDLEGDWTSWGMPGAGTSHFCLFLRGPPSAIENICERSISSPDHHHWEWSSDHNLPACRGRFVGKLAG